MYKDGDIVTLINTKTHGSGNDALTLSSGICGMVVQQRNKLPNGNHEYIVDFGAYGQWHCRHNELDGHDPEDWENDTDQGIEDLQVPAPPPDHIIFGGGSNDLILRSATEQTIENTIKPFKIDPEADIKRRMQEIERGE